MGSLVSRAASGEQLSDAMITVKYRRVDSGGHLKAPDRSGQNGRTEYMAWQLTPKLAVKTFVTLSLARYRLTIRPTGSKES